jgi:hypothetical protein
MLHLLNDVFFANRKKVFLFLLIPAFFIYFKSINFGFSPLDEQWMIVKNTKYLEGSTGFKEAFTRPVAELYYRPLFMSVVAIDYKLGKISPVIYHFTNLVFHLICIFLVFRFLTVFKVKKQLAFIFTLLFSLHPVLLHAVTWVPGLNDLMLCCFTLLSLIWLRLYMESGKPKHLCLQVLFFLFALLTKESAVSLPVIYLMIYFLSENKKTKQLILFSCIWLGLTAGWLLLRDSIISYYPPFSQNFGTSLKNFLLSFFLTVGKTIAPVQQSVLPTLTNSSLIPGIITVIALVVLSWKLKFHDPKKAIVGLVIFFILLIIPAWASATKTNGEFYEQRLYTSMAGLLLFFSQLKFNFNSRLVVNSFLILTSFYIIKTFVRMDIYKDELSFTDQGLKEAPENYLFHMRKAEHLKDQGNFAEAIKYYDQALKIRPDRNELYNNRGAAYFSAGMYAQAAADFTEAINRSKSGTEYYLLNRCECYNLLNEADKAMQDLVALKKIGVAIDPELENSVVQKSNAKQK